MRAPTSKFPANQKVRSHAAQANFSFSSGIFVNTTAAVARDATYCQRRIHGKLVFMQTSHFNRTEL
jgi:hypothetical protein